MQTYDLLFSEKKNWVIYTNSSDLLTAGPGIYRFYFDSAYHLAGSYMEYCSGLQFMRTNHMPIAD